MQGELEALKPELIKTIGEVDVLVAEIDKEKTEVVEPKKIIAQKEEAYAAEQAAKAKAVKAWGILRMSIRPTLLLLLLLLLPLLHLLRALTLKISHTPISVEC